MSSSDRVILRRGVQRTTGATESRPAAGQPGMPKGPGAGGSVAGGTVAGGTVLRGRSRKGGRAEPIAPNLSAGDGAPNAAASLAAMANAGPLAAELRQMQRIAEERGYAQGHARAEAELRHAIEAVGQLTEQLAGAAPRETTAIAHAIAELSLAVARRIVQREVHLDPTVLCDALDEAVSTINGSPEAHVLLHPSTVGQVRTAWEQRHGLSHLGKRWTFEADPNMPPGGCILRYEHGFVDAGFEAQIEEIGIALDRSIPSFLRASEGETEDVA